MSVYLDYNASAPIDNDVLNRMIEVYRTTIGNPDSRTHDFGDNARSIVEEARKRVAELLSVDSTEVYFTSGATESNNIAIQGLQEYSLSSGKNHIITTAIEHKAVLETVKHMAQIGFEVDIVAPDISGRVSAESITKRVKPNTLLVSVMHVNNETGIIQPVKEIGEYLSDKDVLFHIDATQSCGKLVKELKNIKYNMLSFSAHKMGGPQGIGVLVMRKNNGKRLPVNPIAYGGQQENGIRPGTVPVALVAGCGESCRLALMNYEEINVHSKQIKGMILKEIDKSGLEYQIVGDQEYCIDSTLNVALLGISSEALMLSSKLYCGISNGSACTSKSYSPSYVLKSMGIPDDIISSSIRISWGKNTDLEETKRNIKELLNTAYKMIH